MSTSVMVHTTPFDKEFGTVIEPVGDARLDDLSRDDVIDLFKDSGLLLFRKFGASTEEFERFSNQFSSDFMTYMGGGYKRNVINEDGDKSIMSVNYYIGSPKQSTFALPLHGEMYYIKHRPVLIWFYCVQPALKDGETTVCEGAGLYRALSPATRELFETKRLKYIRDYQEADWMKRFQTDDLDVVEQFCLENGMTVSIDRSNKTVHTEYVYPAIITSRWGGHRVFINNILPVVWQERNGKETNIVRLEDGSRIPDEVVAEINAVGSRLMKFIAWEKGGIAMVDNTRVLHGRNRFDDDVRELYSRMVRSVNW